MDNHCDQSAFVGFRFKSLDPGVTVGRCQGSVSWPLIGQFIDLDKNWCQGFDQRMSLVELFRSEDSW